MFHLSSFYFQCVAGSWAPVEDDCEPTYLKCICIFIRVDVSLNYYTYGIIW